MKNYKINTYPDGSSYVEVEKYTGEWVTWRLNNYESLWHLNQYVEACNHKGYVPQILIPNLIDAQADRRFGNNQSSGLKLVCKFLNQMDANFQVFHPHNPEVVEALMDNVEIVDNSDFIGEVLPLIRKQDSTTYPDVSGDNYIGNPGYYRDDRLDNNIVLMSSDAGGFKPLMKLCDNIGWQGQTASASKSRNLDGTLTQFVGVSNFQGKDILIIDDICVYGGTFRGLSKLLKERNCGKLYLAVSHMTVQDLGVDPVTNYFDKVFTTNSKFDEYYIDWVDQVSNTEFEKVKKVPQNLEIIKLF